MIKLHPASLTISGKNNCSEPVYKLLNKLVLPQRFIEKLKNNGRINVPNLPVFLIKKRFGTEKFELYGIYC